MTTLTDFYTITEQIENENGSIFQIKINKEHSIFEGHFPGKPVTPGVVQLEIVKELISGILKKEVYLNKLTVCKYLAVLDPTEYSDIVIEIQLKIEEIGYKTQVIFRNESLVFTKLSAIYQARFLNTDSKE